MNFQKLIPTLMTKDVEATIEFYRSKLGFELVQTVPDAAPFSWAKIKSGGIEVAFQEQAEMQWDIPELQDSEAGGSFTLRVEMKGVKALYERIKDDVEISLTLWEYAPGVHEFRLRDCNGYFWTFVDENSPEEKN